MSVSTFKKINAVVVDLSFAQAHDAYLDAGFATGGAFAGAVAQELQTQASTGVCYKGMPMAENVSTGTLVPISQASNTAQARFVGVTIEDITPYVVAKGVKISTARRGKVRSYAGATLTHGQPVKPDTSAAFSGFVPWVSGTDDATLLAGYAYPLTDGNAIAQGDQIFVELV